MNSLTFSNRFRGWGWGAEGEHVAPLSPEVPVSHPRQEQAGWRCGKFLTAKLVPKTANRLEVRNGPGAEERERE